MLLFYLVIVGLPDNRAAVIDTVGYSQMPARVDLAGSQKTVEVDCYGAIPQDGMTDLVIGIDDAYHLAGIVDG